jgi:hypothetical protein
MDKLNLEVVEQATKEIAGGEPKSPLEEGFRDYDFIGIWSMDLFPLSRPPLETCAGRKKMVINQLEDLALINGGILEHIWARGSHGGRERALERRECGREERVEMAAMKARVHKGVV